MSYLRRLSISDESFCISICESICKTFLSNTNIFPTQRLTYFSDIERQIKLFKEPLYLEIQNSVLLFPPLDSRGRFLIHKCTEYFPYLSSVSIGVSEARRVIVCPLIETTTVTKSQKRTMSSSRNCSRKPDKAIYVPKHRRSDSPNPQKADDENKTEKSQKLEKSLTHEKKAIVNCDVSEYGVNGEVKNNELRACTIKPRRRKESPNPQKADDENKTEKLGKLEKSLTSKKNQVVISDISKSGDVKNSELSACTFKLENLHVSNVDNEKFHVNKMMQLCATCVAGKLVTKILDDSLQVLRQRLLLVKSLRRRRVVDNSPRIRIQQERILPGMATNCVNLAIENAMQMLKAVNCYEKRKNSTVLNSHPNFLCLDNASTSSGQNVKSAQCINEDIFSKSKEKDNNKQSLKADDSKIISEDELKTDTQCKDDGCQVKVRKIEESSNKTTKSKGKKQNSDKAVKNSHNIETTDNKKQTLIADDSKIAGEDELKIDTKTREIKTPKSKGKKRNNNKKNGKKAGIISTDTLPLHDEKPSTLKKSKGASKMKKLKKDNQHQEKPAESVSDKSAEPALKVTDALNDIKSKELEEQDEADDWDANWTEDGECLNDEMKKELSSLTGIAKPSIEKAEGIDYLNFTPTKTIELDEGEFGHILELFDFSPVLKTQEIFNSLKGAGINDYNLTWVDDTHILAVFGSQTAAHNALKLYVPVLQMRQVVNASRSSKVKARELKDTLLPYKKRPESTGMVARNLVAGALGIRSNVTREQRLKEKEMLKEARDARRRKKQDQRDVWDGPDE